jgi:hypothetical protein
MTASLERRLRQFRSRVLVRSWGYRQRHHARGVWFRLRRAMADAREVYAIAVEEARALEAEGHGLEAVGQALEPPRLIVRVPSARLATVAGARPLAVRLSRELLAAEALALVPFDLGGAHHLR